MSSVLHYCQMISDVNKMKNFYGVNSNLSTMKILVMSIGQMNVLLLLKENAKHIGEFAYHESLSQNQNILLNYTFGEVFQ